MKKFITAMIMVTIMMVTVFASAEMPEIHLYDLDNMDWMDAYDIHMELDCNVPESGNAHIVLAFSFTEEGDPYDTWGKATYYDGDTGEYKDEIEGWLTTDIDCSSKDFETVRKNIMDYVMNYNYEADEANGMTYYSIWF